MSHTEQPPAIADYGLIGNCRTAALVSNSGSIDWCCFPYFDSESYFASLLDRTAGGYFSLQPSVAFASRQAYIPETNVLETSFKTATGKARLTDCFSVTTEARKKRMFFPSTEILRKLEVTEGTIPFQLIFAPKPHYNSHDHTPSDQGRAGIHWTCGHDELRLITEVDLHDFHWREGPGGMEVLARFILEKNQHKFFSVSYHQLAPALLPALGEQAELRLQHTLEYWKEWAGKCTYHGVYRSAVERSALALKLLTFAPSGAIVAAPTTSLPESIGGVRNWDYRYGWTRDAAFAVRALLRLGYRDEASAYLNWMLDTGAGARGHYQVIYTLFGARTPRERVLGWLSGYRGSRPVRIGNAARDQFQLDIYGEVLDAVLSFSRDGMAFDGETRRYLINMGRYVCASWRLPDDGIWEPRAQPQHHTHSKVMAWVALDKLVSFGREPGIRGVPLAEFTEARAQIRETLESRAYNPELRSYTAAFGSKMMDAALLTLPLVGYCPADSPRMLGTLNQVRRQLARDELVYRYLEMDDGLPGREGCFGVCSFWLVDALARSGHRTTAQGYFERLLARSNPVGLWSEEIDPLSGEFLGNYPQAFTHIGLINSALTLKETAI